MRKAELSYFKGMLEERKEQIIKNIELLEKEAQQLKTLDVRESSDIASVSSEENLDANIKLKQEKELNEINSSLKRIENREYGICVMCEEDINFQRLKAKPHAKYCIDCKSTSESEKI